MHMVTTRVLALAATAAFLQDVAGQARAGHAEGVADGDRAAVDVVLLRIDAERCRGSRGTGRRRLRSAPTGRCRRPSGRDASSRRGTANTGPMPISSGSQPATAQPMKRAQRLAGRGVSASLASISTTAAAPSESCEALPAVMNLPGPLTGSSLDEALHAWCRDDCTRRDRPHSRRWSLPWSPC